MFKTKFHSKRNCSEQSKRNWRNHTWGDVITLKCWALL